MHLAKHESGSFSWNEADPGESSSKEGLPTEVADSLPTVRMSRSSESEETHRDLPKGGPIDPFGATLDDSGAARLELDQTLPPIRAPSARLIAPSLPEKPVPTPLAPVLVATESAPTEPELEPPPANLRHRKRTPNVALLLVAAALVLALVALVLLLLSSGEEVIVADPPARVQ